MAFVVFAGQSNIGGAFMDASTLPAPWKPDPLTFIWDASKQAFVQMSPGQNTGYGPLPQAWGPEVSFALDFRARYPNEALYIVKEAQGGAQLAPNTQQWAYDWSPRSSGEFLDIATQHIASAAAAIGASRPDVVFWGQGETDAESAATAAAYGANLTEFIAVVRARWLHNEAGHVGLFEIGTSPAFADQVRSAEVAVVASDANSLIFDTAGLPHQSDNLHFTAAGYTTIGDDFFQQFQTWREGGGAGYSLTGGAGADTLVGKAGDDTFSGGGGDDLITGGPGHNVALYGGKAADYSITVTADGWVVRDLRPGAPDGADLLRQIELVRFSDGALSLTHPVSLGDALVSAMEAVLRQDPAVTWSGAMANELAWRQSNGASFDSVVSQIVQAAQSSTSVATLAYEFFTGSVPTAGGMDFLVNPIGPNPNNLNSAYYQAFGLENRYINFASNLGRAGQGSAQFASDYGSLTPEQAMTRAYQTIFGGTPSADKVSHLLHDLVPNGVGGSYERLAYFQSYGGDGPTGIGTKAAMVGWLLAEAVKADLGTYALSNDAFLTDVALHNAPFGVDIIGHYAQAGFAYTPG